MAIFIHKTAHEKPCGVFLCLLIGIFILPSAPFAGEAMQTYDKESIRYTSMDTGQVWAKVGGSSSARQDADISPNLTEEFQSRKKDAALSSEIKKRLLNCDVFPK